MFLGLYMMALAATATVPATAQDTTYSQVQAIMNVPTSTEGLLPMKNFAPSTKTIKNTRIFAIIALVLWLLAKIFNLFNLYHWGNKTKDDFKHLKVNKNFWYISLIVVPNISIVLLLIKFVGVWLFFAAYLYYILMSVAYFFWIRLKLK